MNGIMALIFYISLRRENRRKDKMYGPPPTESEGAAMDVDSQEYRHKWGLEGMTRDEIIELGDKHPAYRYIL
jgi:hypothetical protein